MQDNPSLIAGQTFPWKAINGYFTRVSSFNPVSEFLGDKVGKPILKAYGFVDVELPNPDVSYEQRIITLPIENKSDYRSLNIAHNDKEVQVGTNEVVLLYEHRRDLFGGFKACFHLAIYPEGTWNCFYEKVESYAANEFKWPKPLVSFRPSNTNVFPQSTNIFKAI